MRDLKADWKKWGSAERLLATALMLILLGLPLRDLNHSRPTLASMAEWNQIQAWRVT